MLFGRRVIASDVIYAKKLGRILLCYRLLQLRLSELLDTGCNKAYRKIATGSQRMRLNDHNTAQPGDRIKSSLTSKQLIPARFAECQIHFITAHCLKRDCYHRLFFTPKRNSPLQKSQILILLSHIHFPAPLATRPSGRPNRTSDIQPAEHRDFIVKHGSLATTTALLP